MDSSNLLIKLTRTLLNDERIECLLFTESCKPLGFNRPKPIAIFGVTEDGSTCNELGEITGIDLNEFQGGEISVHDDRIDYKCDTYTATFIAKARPVNICKVLGEYISEHK